MRQDLADWKPCAPPGETVLKGQYALCEPYEAATHVAGLVKAFSGAENAALWHYMPFGPFKSEAELSDFLARANGEAGWRTMVIRCCSSGEILGMASYMRIREAHGSAEVGAVTFSRKLQRSRTATDAMFLMARQVFDELGYRRYEWKCNNDNEASKRAAERLGFPFEGIFRNDMVMKGRNRDTAWYAITDDDWPKVKSALYAWLSPDNFDIDGQQRRKLMDVRND